MTAPAADAPFSAKMAYYRTQHTSRGVRLTHMIGTPVIAAAIPLLSPNPEPECPMFLGGWIFQIAGHTDFRAQPALDSTRAGSPTSSPG